MTKRKMYKYIGYNGTVTTPVLLDGINHLEMVELKASNGCYLTNGQRKVTSIVVLPEEVSNWTEVKGSID
jgi:hypothetical protein